MFLGAPRYLLRCQGNQVCFSHESSHHWGWSWDSNVRSCSSSSAICYSSSQRCVWNKRFCALTVDRELGGSDLQCFHDVTSMDHHPCCGSRVIYGNMESRGICLAQNSTCELWTATFFLYLLLPHTVYVTHDMHSMLTVLENMCCFLLPLGFIRCEGGYPSSSSSRRRSPEARLCGVVQS